MHVGLNESKFHGVACDRLPPPRITLGAVLCSICDRFKTGVATSPYIQRAVQVLSTTAMDASRWALRVIATISGDNVRGLLLVLVHGVRVFVRVYVCVHICIRKCIRKCPYELQVLCVWCT